MPTKPFEPLLFRDLRKVEAKAVIDIASPLLQEEINYATNLFHRCQESSTGGPDEDLPILVSYLHVIEMIDGIEVLVSQSCSNPAIPLLRSAFEALLTIEYLLESDYRRRSFSWLVTYFHERLKQYEMLDPLHHRGKELRNDIGKDQAGEFMNLLHPQDLSKAIDNLKSLLNKKAYQIVAKEYQNLKERRKSRFNWFTLFQGPSNLRELASCLHRPAQYEILYRHWSQVSHAGDMSRFLTESNKEGLAFTPFRTPGELKHIAGMASSFILDASNKILLKFRAGEKVNYSRWYVREVRQNHLALNKV